MNDEELKVEQSSKENETVKDDLSNSSIADEQVENIKERKQPIEDKNLENPETIVEELLDDLSSSEEGNRHEESTYQEEDDSGLEVPCSESLSEEENKEEQTEQEPVTLGVEDKKKLWFGLPKWKFACLVGGVLIVFSGFMAYLVRDTENIHKSQALKQGCEIQFYQDDVIEIEYGSDVQSQDLVESYKGDLVFPKLDTFKVGEQDLKFKLSAGEYETTVHKKVEIVDSHKPKLEIDIDDEITLQQGQIFSLPKEMKASDPVDGDLEVQVNNSVNTQNIGEYIVTFSATDKNDNRTEKQVTVYVVEAEKENSDPSMEIAEDLTAYEKINDSTLSVRGVTVHLGNELESTAIHECVRQINSTPAYLLGYVDEVTIQSEEQQKTLFNKENVIASSLEEKGKVHVYLSENIGEEPNAFIKQCVWAFSQEIDLSDKKFKKIVKSEKQKWTDQDISTTDYFVETYTSYLVHGFDTLKEKVPNTAHYYQEVQL